MKMKLDYSFYVDPIGIAGGLALWWSHEVSMVILNSGKNFIDTKVSVSGEYDWFLTFIYGPPYANEKQVFWESLASLRSNRLEKWCVIDRILISLEWSTSFPKAIGILGAAIASDHAPILLLLKGMSKRFRKDFKFEAKWILEDGCTDNVQDGWQSVNESNRLWSFGKKLS
ncbi:hypothetical protein V6N11_072849 [Hibiscus sabdariffa]|uniref:Uncharacterized protein n=1 Tax=Hibiscus sabdariffa TaxID=183260 RepID=A0ABR2A6F9_9ROSI